MYMQGRQRPMQNIFYQKRKILNDKRYRIYPKREMKEA